MSAVISPDGKYRYLLSRKVKSDGTGRVVFIMLNPSTADAETDDPTIRRCIGYTERWGYTQLDVINLFAYRATDPRAVIALPRAEALGPENHRYGNAVCHQADMVVCAWGNGGMWHDEGCRALAGMRKVGVHPYALKVNRATGEPAHPLYLKADLVPFPI